MKQRVSLITLGVADVAEAERFYRALGWVPVESPDGIVVFDLIGQSLGLYPIEKLAEDIGVPVSELGTGAMTLSHNLRDRAGVDALVARAQTAGAKVLSAPSEVFWGGYVAYFRAPDGHIWEITHNPYSELSPEGAFCWNGYQQG